MPRIVAASSLVLLLAVPTLATAQGFTRRDSAGIRVVETKTPVWGTAARWSVEPKPMLSVGQTDGADPYLFSLVMGAVRRKDGSIIVGDLVTRELRTFDATGKFIAAKGRKGQGPAEFSTINYMARCGPDELWIDAGSRRISVWSMQLEYRREFVVATNNTMWPLMCFDGTGLMVKNDIHDPDETHPNNTVYPVFLNLVILDSLGRNPHNLRKIQLRSELSVMRAPRQFIDFPHPFYPSTSLAPAGRDVVMTTGDRPEVLTYSRDGKLTRIVRAPAEDLTLTAAMRRAYQAAGLELREKQTRDWLSIAGYPMPKTIPAFAALLVDSDGNTWAKRFSIPGDPANRWGIFGRDGEFLGHLLLPPGLTVFEIGPDYILGTVRDSLQVEQVRVYRLRK